MRWSEKTNRFGTSLVAVAESIRTSSDRAEFAIAVLDDWQSLGIGSLLIYNLAARAVATGVKY